MMSFSFYIILQKEKADTLILFLYDDKLEKSNESNYMTKINIAFTVALFLITQDITLPLS